MLDTLERMGVGKAFNSSFMWSGVLEGWAWEAESFLGFGLLWLCQDAEDLALSHLLLVI